MTRSRLAQKVDGAVGHGAAVAASEPLDAGDFDHWLADIQSSFQDGAGTNVPCGTCRGCCTSSYFVHIKPADTGAMAAIPRHLRSSAPGLPPGHALMGYGADGHCPMLKAGNCSIYADRPSTCKDYDCRIFAAAGLVAGGPDKAAINARVSAWRFRYASPQSRQTHAAIQAAARFLQDHKGAFPGGRVPTQPSDIAVLAIKVHTVFLQANDPRTPQQIAQDLIQASRAFDAAVHPRPR